MKPPRSRNRAFKSSWRKKCEEILGHTVLALCVIDIKGKVLTPNRCTLLIGMENKFE